MRAKGSGTRSLTTAGTTAAILTVLILTVFLIVLSAVCSYADSSPYATGQVKATAGAYLRKSSSTTSAKVVKLKNNTRITIHKEVFKSKTSTSAKKRWYYVTAGSSKGYIRADLVDNIKYSAVSAKVTGSLNYRKGAGIKMAKKGTLKKGKAVKLYLTAAPVSSAKGDSSTWYKTKVGSKYYYVCSSKIEITEVISDNNTSANDTSANDTSDNNTSVENNDNSFDAYLTEQGFPETYKTRLRALHVKHPNWVFTAKKTGLAWKTVLSKESADGVSLIYKSYPSSYRAAGSKSKDGASWYNANSQVVGYYLDPRNFLDEDRIYMFEDLSYDPKYQTSAVVTKILTPTKLPGNGFTAKLFMNAGATYNVSPVHLASRARQETGGGSIAITGYKISGKKVYNPFNIGASGGISPVLTGLKYAYNKGWTTQTKSVNGGALFIAGGYISKGQNTIYYQRFNVANGAARVATHQYMTNIMAPYSEAYSTGTAYKSYKITNEALAFEIPVYTGMPAVTSLP